MRGEGVMGCRDGCVQLQSMGSCAVFFAVRFVDEVMLCAIFVALELE